jgi:hypothetical protein
MHEAEYTISKNKANYERAPRFETDSDWQAPILLVPCRSPSSRAYSGDHFVDVNKMVWSRFAVSEWFPMLRSMRIGFEELRLS